MKQSARFELNKKDLIEAGKNALVFLAPTLIVLLPSLAGIVPSDWKYAVIVIYLLNRATDLLKRYVAGK